MFWVGFYEHDPILHSRLLCVLFPVNFGGNRRRLNQSKRVCGLPISWGHTAVPSRFYPWATFESPNPNPEVPTHCISRTASCRISPIDLKLFISTWVFIYIDGLPIQVDAQTLR